MGSSISEGALEELISTLGEDKVLNDELNLSAYSYDASGITARPEAVVRVSSVDEVVAVMEIANKYRIPVTPRGGGTSLVGGPLNDEGIILDLQNMNAVLDVDEEAGLVRVEAGIRVSELNKLIDDRFMPINPDGTGFSTVGGLIAEDAASPLSAHYGTISDLLLGLEVVLPNGETILVEQPGPPGKRNILHLFAGSEGTLGVFTSAYLKLPKRPQSTRSFIIEITDVSEAFAINDRLEEMGVEVWAFEVIHNYKDIVGGESESLGYIEIDGSPECVDSWAGSLEGLLHELGITYHEVDSDELIGVWEGRRSLYEASKSTKLNMKVVSMRVHRHLLRKMVQEVDKIAVRMNLRNLVVIDPPLGWAISVLLYDPSDEMEVERARRASETLISRSVPLGGSVGYGVGLGLSYMTEDIDEGFVRIFTSIKETLDPNWIMNPGKIVGR